MAKKTVKIAIAYDFDGTLAKGNIQENSYIPYQLNMSKNDFWNEVGNLADAHKMDQILAYMYLLISKANENDASYTKTTLRILTLSSHLRVAFVLYKNRHCN